MSLKDAIDRHLGADGDELSCRCANGGPCRAINEKVEEIHRGTTAPTVDASRMSYPGMGPPSPGRCVKLPSSGPAATPPLVSRVRVTESSPLPGTVMNRELVRYRLVEEGRSGAVAVEPAGSFYREFSPVEDADMWVSRRPGDRSLVRVDEGRPPAAGCLQRLLGWLGC